MKKSKQNLPTHQAQLPISTRWLIRIMVALIVTLALAAGFFQSAYQTSLKKTDYLETRLEILTNHLGERQTQQIINQQLEN
ncbi:MAG: hypothetical protein GF381_04590 [Candidatus Pacebacteria bacterium]|nr:hypothetical protein [Candidatus Paceibacterota bacterium]